jgi:hypothetical protein
VEQAQAGMSGHEQSGGVPVILPFSDEDLEELFQFLVDTLRLSISLWVVGGGRCGLNSE